MHFGNHVGYHVVHIVLILGFILDIVGHCGFQSSMHLGYHFGRHVAHFGVIVGFTFVILGAFWAPKWRPNRLGDSFGDLWLPQALP